MYIQDIQRNDMKSITAMFEILSLRKFRNAKFVTFGGSQVKRL